MVADRIALVGNPARISADIKRLEIAVEGQPPHHVLPEDIAVMILDHERILITQPALRLLALHNAAMIVTDHRHMPAGLYLPMSGIGAQKSRLAHQIAVIHTELPDRCWQQIISARIRTQASNLRLLGCNGALRLERLADQVLPGDPGNIEAQAARHYWSHLFEDSFKRFKQGAEDRRNAALNYGYAILRALVARELAAAGLATELGVHHANAENPHNLADDLMEPFRFLVEQHVAGRLGAGDELDRPGRIKMLSIIEAVVAIGEENYRLPAAVRTTVQSFARTIERQRQDLKLPGFQMHVSWAQMAGG